MRSAAPLDRVVDRLERLSSLDRISELLASAARRVIRPGAIEDLLSGTPIGHPAHPMVVAVPIGAWTSATVLDLTGGDAGTTRALVAIGTLATVPAAATGASDWLTTTGAERRIGVVHALANTGAITLQLASWRARATNRRAGAVLSVAALAFTAVSGWLGGHLAYAQGVGVDTTAFQRLPTDWTDLCADADVSATPSRHDVGGVPLVAYRTGERVVVLADRCTHRGAPLHEGTVEGGCITCPWHGSVFNSSGQVVSGPATRPQPELEVRSNGGRIQVRRDEQRSLRLNPVT